LIAEHTQVMAAELREGVLKVTVNLVVPETLKPRLLEIA
jgi:HSP20 family molecular chaperone IbpA